jgi:hypothetical protein
VADIRLPFGLAALLVSMAMASPASSHHSFAMFDSQRTIELEGTVREFLWANPHTWVQLDVVQAGRRTEWSIEGRSPNVLSRRGWNRETLRPGERVTLSVHPLKDGRPGGAIVSVRFADGRLLNADTPTAVDTNEEGPRQ